MDKLIISDEGYPGTTEFLQFVEKSSHDQISALVKAVGNNCIITGLEVDGANLTDGWIIYNNELLPFENSVVGSTIVIVESTALGGYDVDDNGDFSTILPIWKTRKAKFGNPADPDVVANFAFSELERLTSLQNTSSVKVNGEMRLITTLLESYVMLTGGSFTNIELLGSVDNYRFHIKVDFPEILGDYHPIINYSRGDTSFVGTAFAIITEKTTTSMSFTLILSTTDALVEYDRRIDITLIQ